MRLTDFSLNFGTMQCLVVMIVTIMIGCIAPQWGLEHILTPIAFAFFIIGAFLLCAKFSW